MRTSLKVAAAFATPVLAGVLSLAAAGVSQATVHPHATTVCNNSTQPCTNISNLMLNQDNGPAFIQNATTGQASIGRRVNMRQASNTRTNEDFVITLVGTLGQLCGTSGVNSIDPTSYACLNYPSFYPVFQGQFAPDSNESGMCVGALAATAGFKARLVPCGSPRSMWVADLGASIQVTFPGPLQFLLYFPLEFASDTSASNPLVLTYDPNSTKPANGLFLQRDNFSGGTTPDRQMFTLTRPAGLI